jgi:hypothetical protein
LRQNTGSDCDRPGPMSSRPISGSNCDAMTTSAAIIQNQSGPGRNVQPATSITSSASGTTLRLRLSRIFHRAIRDSAFLVKPRREGTNGNSQKRICQSPRIQRC